MTFRSRLDAAPEPLARTAWQLAPDGCSIGMQIGTSAGIYEVVYTAAGSPVAGLGLAAIRDFASFLKYGGGVTTLPAWESPDP